jgi:hypothetical protein
MPARAGVGNGDGDGSHRVGALGFWPQRKTSQQWSGTSPSPFVTSPSGACEVEACQTEVWQGEPKSREPTRQERGQKRAKCEPKCESSARKCESAP